MYNDFDIIQFYNSEKIELPLSRFISLAKMLFLTIIYIICFNYKKTIYTLKYSTNNI